VGGPGALKAFNSLYYKDLAKKVLPKTGLNFVKIASKAIYEKIIPKKAI
jgi:hypothetical protein